MYPPNPSANCLYLPSGSSSLILPSELYQTIDLGQGGTDTVKRQDLLGIDVYNSDLPWQDNTIGSPILIISSFKSFENIGGGPDDTSLKFSN